MLMHIGKSDGMIQILYDDNGTPVAITPTVPADIEDIKVRRCNPPRLLVMYHTVLFI